MSDDVARRNVSWWRLDGFNRHDLDAIMSLFADDCVFDSAGPGRVGTAIRRSGSGSRGLGARFEGYVHYGDGRHFVSGDRGVSEWTLTGTTIDESDSRCGGLDLEGDKVLRKDSSGRSSSDEAHHVRRGSGRARRRRRDRRARRFHDARWFERGGVERRATVCRSVRPAARRSCRRSSSTRPATSGARGGVEARRLVARDRTVDRLLSERRRDRRARRGRRPPRAPDGGAGLRLGSPW